MSIASRLNLEHTKWKSCQYKISVTLKFSDGTIRELQSIQIIGLLLEKDYDVDHLPVMLLDLALSEDDENAVDANTEFRIKMVQFYKEDDESEISGSRIYLNDSFVQMNIDDRLNTKRKLIKKRKDAVESKPTYVDPEDLTSQTTYVLVKKKDAIMSKRIVNDVLSGVSMYDTVMFLLSKYGNADLLISNFTNTQAHSELLLEPNQLLVTLIELESEYGWHKEGTYLFLDFGMMYILRKNAKCTVWREGEPSTICFCISDVTSSDNIPKGIITTRDKIYFNLGRNQCSFADATEVNDHTRGGNMMIVDESSGNVRSVKGSGKTTVVRSHRGHNPYVSTQYKRQQYENTNRLQLTCLNGDLDYLTPNKRYTFLTDVTEIASKLKGNYRLGRVQTSFVRNGNYFDTISTIDVKGVPNS